MDSEETEPLSPEGEELLRRILKALLDTEPEA